MRNTLGLLLLALCVASCANSKQEQTTKRVSYKQTQAKKVLVYSKTLGWRHKSIETGVKTIQDIGDTHNFAIIHTEDSLHFVQEFLPQYDAIIFLSTTGNVLDDKGQKAFEKYIQGGGSFLGIHSAADTEYDWPWYGKLVGGYFESHPNDPNIRNAKIRKAGKHPTTKHLEKSFEIADEWYNYKNLNKGVTPVLLLDEKSYEGGTNGDYHPISWFHLYDGGKAFYIGAGHPKEAYTDLKFRKHLEEALLWSLE